jgi:hypothetical protein
MLSVKWGRMRNGVRERECDLALRARGSAAGGTPLLAGLGGSGFAAMRRSIVDAHFGGIALEGGRAAERGVIEELATGSGGDARAETLHHAAPDDEARSAHGIDPDACAVLPDDRAIADLIEPAGIGAGVDAALDGTEYLPIPPRRSPPTTSCFTLPKLTVPEKSAELPTRSPRTLMLPAAPVLRRPLTTPVAN